MTKHHHARTPTKKASPTYNSWSAMIQRCRNKKHEAYERYGGRGITICERWMDFTNFLADMGIRPKGLTLERIKNNEGYKPGNCRWATYKEQAQNVRRLPRKRGSKLTREQIAKILSLPHLKGYEVAAMFGVAQSHISRIRHGIRWSSVAQKQKQELDAPVSP